MTLTAKREVINFGRRASTGARPQTSRHVSPVRLRLRLSMLRGPGEAGLEALLVYPTVERLWRARPHTVSGLRGKRVFDCACPFRKTGVHPRVKPEGKLFRDMR